MTRGRALLVGWAALAFSLFQKADAQAPPYAPFQLYGRALIAGTNLRPETQVVIALIGGVSCGDGLTFRPTGDDVPPADRGRTVYAITVVADGARPAAAPGCGRAGATVTLYFPEVGEISGETAIWQPGDVARMDVDLGTLHLSYRTALPGIAADP